MSDSTALGTAREILGGDVVGLEELRDGFGAVEGLTAERANSVPFSVAELRGAKERGEILILRAARCNGEPLTLQWLINRFSTAFDRSLLRKMGYQLKDDWGIELEPLATTAVCRSQWALVQRVILEPTRNLSYDEQDEELERYAQQRGASGKLRRRTAIEIAFDTLAVYHARGERLLADTWDWSATRTLDGGYLNLGRFTDQGMQVLSYSRAIRHGRLGVCPTRDPD